ncbi:hypothetical protein Pcinc_015185 [Petrolisthes cinctipes]|uniref:Crustin n=1 Tax=Petrolisthes cinctipes TaxID=88211 RepID=A0AAE1FVH1_PETCI|nr:hypothetical protein Pcinc_015185 [Petrolisthes cinctipes]
MARTMLLMVLAAMVCMVAATSVPFPPPCNSHCPKGAFGNYVCCDENPGDCPPTRLVCPHHRIQSLQPRYCDFDPECYGSEKCCNDACLPSKVCKPSIYR